MTPTATDDRCITCNNRTDGERLLCDRCADTGRALAKTFPTKPDTHRPRVTETSRREAEKP